MQDILAQSPAGVFDAACRENAFFLGSAPGRVRLTLTLTLNPNPTPNPNPNPIADAYSCANDTLFYRDFYERACVQGDIACSQYGSCTRPA